LFFPKKLPVLHTERFVFAECCAQEHLKLPFCATSALFLPSALHKRISNARFAQRVPCFFRVLCASASQTPILRTECFVFAECRAQAYLKRPFCAPSALLLPSAVRKRHPRVYLWRDVRLCKFKLGALRFSQPSSARNALARPCSVLHPLLRLCHALGFYFFCFRKKYAVALAFWAL
jgi:hypothetical protein